MTCDDWRDAPVETLAPLYAAERRRWAQALGWDLGPALTIVERARSRGELPGLLLRDANRTPAGWAYYLVAQRILQIGGVHGTSAGAVRLLLDHIVSSPEAQMAHGLSAFLFPGSSSIASALTRLRFTHQSHDYLVAALPLGAPPRPHTDVVVRPWQHDDAAAAVRLLARAYAGDPFARCFAPHGQLEEWAHYVGRLLHTPACGALLPAATLVVERAGTLAGIVLTTMVAPSTAHIAQVAVDPVCRRLGIAYALVRAACRAATAAGARRVTLLVGADNAGARALYGGLGFAPMAAFLYASRGPVPRRARPAAAPDQARLGWPPPPSS